MDYSVKVILTYYREIDIIELQGIIVKKSKDIDKFEIQERDLNKNERARLYIVRSKII